MRACNTLRYLYNHTRSFLYQVNEWVEKDQQKAMQYKHKICLNTKYIYKCLGEKDGDETPPLQWLVDRAKALEFRMPKFEFQMISKNDEYHANTKEKTNKRSRIVRYKVEPTKKIWQLNENLAHKKENLFGSYFLGTTVDICLKYIPKDDKRWRLPTKKELLKVVYLFSKKRDFKYYWTGDSSANDPMDYWIVDVQNGNTHEVYKNNYQAKGCVYVREM